MVNAVSLRHDAKRKSSEQKDTYIFLKKRVKMPSQEEHNNDLSQKLIEEVERFNAAKHVRIYVWKISLPLYFPSSI